METLACCNEHWEDGRQAFGLLMQVIKERVEAKYFRATTDIETTALTIWSYRHGLVTIYLKKRLNMFQDNREMGRIQQSFSLFIKMIKDLLSI